MRTLTSVALAGVLAMGAISTAPVTADAGGKRNYHHYHRYHQPQPDPGAGIVAGAIVGLAVGALAAPVFSPVYAYPPTYVYVPPGPAPYAAATGNAHMDWCEATYETYDPETNLWIDYRGVPHECVTPY